MTALAAVVAVIGLAYLWRWIRQPRTRIGVTTILLATAVCNAVTASVATVRNTARAESSINRLEVALGHWLTGNTPAVTTSSRGQRLLPVFWFSTSRSNR